MPLLILNTNFMKAKIENWLHIEFKLGFPWLRIRKHNHQLGAAEWESHDWEPEVQLLKLCKYSQIPLSLPLRRVPSASNRTKTKHHWLIYKLSTSIKFRHLARDKTKGKLPDPWGNTRKSWTHLPSLHSLDKHQKQKNKTWDLLSLFLSCSATPVIKRRTHLLGR